MAWIGTRLDRIPLIASWARVPRRPLMEVSYYNRTRAGSSGKEICNLRSACFSDDWELLVQEMLTFAVADIWFRNTTLSIFLVFLLHHFIRLVCEAYSARNIAESSMVDERFLI